MCILENDMINIHDKVKKIDMNLKHVLNINFDDHYFNKISQQFLDSIWYILIITIIITPSHYTYVCLKALTSLLTVHKSGNNLW